ncbi:LysM peptidoglycan-binding domain-containing protein [Enterococcus camelliae]|uniref:LysM peptidoglycan-binding domain-containing protein n=1 Tax=Enterococcus camelliae TaxID=453959 RepID=A0ABW5TIF0_9ENTE
MKIKKIALMVGITGVTFLGIGMKVSADEVTHTVKSGETLSGISAKYFGDYTRYVEIAESNHIKNVDLIFVGDKLKINTTTGEIVDATAEEATTPATETTESTTTQATDGSVESIVRAAASAYGWGSGANWEAISFIIQHESSWNPNAQNPTSTAYGLFQMLVETSSDPAVQAANGMAYIAGRYGTPINAMAFWQANNWY